MLFLRKIFSLKKNKKERFTENNFSKCGDKLLK